MIVLDNQYYVVGFLLSSMEEEGCHTGFFTPYVQLLRPVCIWHTLSHMTNGVKKVKDTVIIGLAMLSFFKLLLVL
jgi:hypothetical protein